MTELQAHMEHVHGIVLTMERAIRSGDVTKAYEAFHRLDHQHAYGRAYPGWNHRQGELFYPGSD